MSESALREPRTYDHLAGRRLQRWYSVRIEDRLTSQAVSSQRSELFKSKFVIACSTIHVNKELELPTCYSASFTDAEILDDPLVYSQFTARYGSDIFS